MINNTIHRLKLGNPLKNKSYCTMKIYRVLLYKSFFPKEKSSLDEACIKFNIDLNPRSKGHGALIDSKLTAQLLIVNVKRNYIIVSKEISIVQTIIN